MFGRISYTFSIMGASWRVLKKDGELLVYALLSGICMLIVSASFILPVIMTKSYALPEPEATPTQQTLYWVVGFLFYFSNYFVITFFNTAIVGSAVIRMQGGDPKFKDGLAVAISKIHLIVGWALIAATVGIILNALEQRFQRVGQIVISIVGMAWTAVSFLVIPVMVVEGTGPIKSLKTSTRLLRQTWGEQVVGGFGFGIIFFLLSLPAIALLIVGMTMGVPAPVCIVLAIVYFLIIALVQSTLRIIFQAALYLHAAGDYHDDEGFDPALFTNAMVMR